jgi:hypothetical protein
MKLQTLFSKVEKSEKFKEIKKENKDIFFCAGFMILNFKQKVFEYSLDYRNDKSLFAFKMAGEDQTDPAMSVDPIIEGPKPLEAIDEKNIPKVKCDIEDIEKIAQKALLDNNVKNTLDEAIAVLQISNDKLIWNLTCICSSFVIINMHIDPLNGKVLKFEKRNLMDFASVKKVDKK